MEFDRSRVYSAVNADELKPGDKVIVADDLFNLKEFVRKNDVHEIEDILSDKCSERFGVCGMANYALAYLVERAENCTNCVYEGSAGCSVVEICGENKSTHRCHMYEAKDTKRNLCDSCKYSFAECSATANDIVFGDRVGNDNVYECDKYEQKSTVRCINCEHYSTYGGYCHKHDEPTMYDNTCPDYRLVKQKTEQKIEPHYRPFRDTDELIKTWIAKRMITFPDLCMPHIWVQRKGMNTQELITGFDRECMEQVKTNDVWRGMYDLFTLYTFLDGSPCGVEE